MELQKQSLYDIATELEGLQLALSDDAPGDADEILTNWIATNSKLTEKVDAVVGFARSLEGHEKMYANEAAYLADKAKACKNKRDRLKRCAMNALAILGASKVEGRMFKIRSQSNGGQIPITVEDVGMLPGEYQRILVEPDMVAIRTAVEEGKSIPGVVVGERGTHVRFE